MKIKEAIQHCRKVAAGATAQGKCPECAADHAQLADWLEELVAYKAAKLDPDEIELMIEAQEIGDNLTPQRLAEILRAEQDGRLVVLPQGVTCAALEDEETYTTGYRNGRKNGRMELLRRILGLPNGTRQEAETAERWEEAEYR